MKSVDRKGFLFDNAGLAANTVVSGVGAGVATVATVGASAPLLAVVIGLAGAVAGYAATNEIRKEADAETCD